MYVRIFVCIYAESSFFKSDRRIPFVHVFACMCVCVHICADVEYSRLKTEVPLHLRAKNGKSTPKPLFASVPECVHACVICACACVSACVHVCVCAYVCGSMCELYVCVCVCACVCACVCVCVCVCLCVCVCVCVCVILRKPLSPPRATNSLHVILSSSSTSRCAAAA